MGDTLFTRHSLKAKEHFYDFNSKKYPGLIWRGVRKARKATKNILAELEQTPNNSIFFLGGSSEEIRTKSTARVYGSELKKLLKGRTDYVVVTEEDIASSSQVGYSSVIDQLRTIANANPDKRVIVDVPLFVKEFSMRRTGWLDSQGKRTPYAKRLMKKANDNQPAAFKYWVETDGAPLDGSKGPNPLEVAKSYAKGVERLEQFVARHIPNRPIVTGFVGHAWDLDIFLTYLANGKINLASYDQVRAGGSMVKETELGSFRMDKDTATLTYRGRQHSRKLEHLVAAVGVIGILGAVFSLSGVTGNVVGASYNNPLGIISVIVFLTAMLLYSVIRELKA